MAWESQFMAFDAQYPGENGVEGAHPDIPGLISNDFLNAFPHFAGCFIGKGKCQYIKRVNKMRFYKVCDTVGKHAGLPGTCACDNQ